MRDIRQSPNYAKYMESLGWIVEKGVFIKKLWFTSVVKAQRFSSLPDLLFLKNYRPFLIKLEPDVNFKFEILNLKFRKDNWPLLPTKTIILDLKKLNLPKDTKYEIRKATSNNLTIQQRNNPDLFYKLLQETMKIGHWEVPIRKEVTALWQAFQPKNSQILLTYAPQDPRLPQSSQIPVAGCLLIWDGNIAHYMYAALTKRGRELGAAYFTLWEAIKFCQKSAQGGSAPGGKLKYLDLEGVYDDRRPKDNKHWLGFTKFKMGWGGKVKKYPGSWQKVSFLF